MGDRLKLLVLGLVLAGTAQAEVRFVQPVDCVLGETCIIQQFMDHDPSKDSADFACGKATYDGHKGTDFRVSRADMNRGVNVLAAADGVVLRLRDGVDDRRVVTKEDRALIKGKQCGNGMVVRHADGWETQYCHMKKGSVLVKEGQEVQAGEPLGQVGLSGETQFAHLHISIRKDGNLVDPFAAKYEDRICQYDHSNTVWTQDFASAFAYQPTAVFLAGVADNRVVLADLMDGRWDNFEPHRDKPLVVYGLAVNGVVGDQLNLILKGPKGVIVRSLRDALPRRRSQWFAFGGEGPPAGGWPVGRYETIVQIVRDGTVLHEKTGAFMLR